MKLIHCSRQSARAVGKSGVWVVAAALMFAHAAAHAATITVTSLADAGAGSLRDAITTANGNGVDDIINFSVTGTITLASPLPTITTNIDINGPGVADLTISGGNAVQIFVLDGVLALNINNLTIADANVAGNGGVFSLQNGAFLNAQFCNFENNFATGNGGVVWAFTTGSVIFSDCYFLGNGSNSFGGAIDIFGATAGTAVTRCLFDGNSTNAQSGGAISVFDTTDIASSTFVGNLALSGSGGAINTTGGALAIINCTITGNTAAVGGGISGNAFTTFGNNIIHGNTGTSSGPDITGSPVSLGTNIISDVSGWINSPDASDMVGVDPQLGPLTDNGGPTHTMLPNPSTSPAIDAGNNGILTAFANLLVHSSDQRLMPRIDNGTVDIGAVEVGPGDAPPLPVSGPWGLAASAMLVAGTGILLATRRRRRLQG